MKHVYILFFVFQVASGFSILSRRDVIMTGSSAAIATILAPEITNAFSQQLDDHLTEPTQLPTGGKLDLNAAFIGEYKQFRGMFPSAAGKIASHGPYTKVSDIYKIDGLTERDKKLFRQYEKNFTVNPPGRAFKERINGRVST